MERANAWNKYDSKKKAEVFDFAEQYRQFISKCKTERECVKEGVRLLKEAGYADLKDVIADNRTLKAGDKVYAVNMNKALVAFNIGEEPISAGMNILGAHIDSPRLDIKQNPLYEETGLVLIDTHYYGGIKKYQWVAIPLAIHGVVALKNGTTVEIVIGEDMSDTVVGVSDLLIHLASEQMEKKGTKVVEGEALDILVGSMPQEKEECDKEAKDAVKKNILAILKDKYGIEEEDFLSAELEAVPAGPARDYGIDRSMIMGYGHDDRVCAYPSLIALINSSEVKRTGVCILVDKEEIGSVGATGMLESDGFDFAAQIPIAANTQNAIKASDLSASVKYYQEFEKISRELTTSNGDYWFFERARGSYKAEEDKFIGQRKGKNIFRTKYPKEKMFDKTDLAVSALCWDLKPMSACKGAQLAFLEFNEGVKERIPDVKEVKELICKWLIFSTLERRLKEENRKNPRTIVNYSIYLFSKKYGNRIEWSEIWSLQKVPEEILYPLTELAKKLDQTIRRNMGNEMINMFARKDQCLELVDRAEISLDHPFETSRYIR